MGIREQIEEKPGLVATAVGVAILAAGVLLWRGGGVAALFGQPADTGPATAAYTVDDGKTWFVDTRDHLTPFMKDGKPAVRAALFSCDGGKTRFVGFLTRLNDETRVRIERMREENPTQGGLDALIANGTEIKQPQGGQWEPMHSEAGTRLMKVEPPAGQTGPARPISP